MRPNAKKRVKQMHALVIDEAGMMPDYVMDCLNKVFQSIKGNNLPFGGVQIILVLDFLQLGPIVPLIPTNASDENSFLHNGRHYKRGVTPWCFLAACWESLALKPLLLRQSYSHNDNAASEEWYKVLDLISRGDVFGENKLFQWLCPGFY